MSLAILTAYSQSGSSWRRLEKQRSITAKCSAAQAKIKAAMPVAKANTFEFCRAQRKDTLDAKIAKRPKIKKRISMIVPNDFQ